MTQMTRRLRAGAAIVLGGFVSASDAWAATASRTDRAVVDAAAIYTRGAAVIEDKRSVTLAKGKQRLIWPLGGRLQADTLWLAGQGIRLNVFETRSHRAENAGELAARLGRPVLLASPGEGREPVAGTLIAVDGDIAYVRVGDTIRRVTPSSSTELRWRGGLASRAAPALSLELEARAAGRRELTATYQIAGPTWHASYTGRFYAADATLALRATAVIDNTGRAALDADRAWLVAGDVARADESGPRPMLKAARAVSADGPAGAPRAVGDVYRYALAGGLHLPAGASRGVALAPPVSIAAERRYRFRHDALADSGDERSHALIELRFDNTSNAPLPAGTVRVYDAGRAAGLMGAAEIDDTPAGGSVDLVLGRAFDITATHRAVGETAPVDGFQTRTIEITLDNASARPAAIDLIEDLPQQATLVSASRKPQAQDNVARANWRLDIPAKTETTLRYRIRWPARS